MDIATYSTIWFNHKETDMVRMMFMEGNDPGMGRLVVDITGRRMAFRETRCLQSALVETGLVEKDDCSSDFYTSGFDAGKHFIEINYNTALSDASVRRLLDATRYNISRILSEETVVCCCRCHAGEYLVPTLQ